jgi:hypothetical protein
VERWSVTSVLVLVKYSVWIAVNDSLQLQLWSSFRSLTMRRVSKRDRDWLCHQYNTAHE